jgi:sugar/nucleoside kinase (ribokinase family)
MGFGLMKYRAMIATGGIGTGTFFALNGNHTLGREESRSGHYLDQKDYCKQHIITHYVKKLSPDDFVLFPIGKVGNDAAGHELIHQMEQVGMRLDYVQVIDDAPTMISLCLVYPDNSGGNLTVDHSACALVSSDDIEAATEQLKKYHNEAIVLAVPEVALASRKRLLELGTEYGAFRVASFLSEEMAEVQAENLLQHVDLLAINRDEAMRLTGLEASESLEEFIKKAVDVLLESYPDLTMSITAGSSGSWIWDGEQLSYTGITNANVATTAGAGDAHLAGLLVGLNAGLPLNEAQVLAGLVSGLSVTVADTLYLGIDWQKLTDFSAVQTLIISDSIIELLREYDIRKEK